MFDTSTPTAPNPTAAGMAAVPLRPGTFPLELETEFAEAASAVPSGGVLPGLLCATLLFHGLLIAERSLTALPPRMFAARGGPVTALLLVFLLLPALARKARPARAFLVFFMALLVAALLAGTPFAGAGQLLPMQTGVAALLLLLGWLTALPQGWTFLLTGSALLVDAAALCFGPAMHTAGSPVILESFWAPGCASALLLLLASVRHGEARRDFLLLRQSAFADVRRAAPAEQADTRDDALHLDPQTGVANRAAFDMRFRAAWDNAAARRSSIALLFFSIDNLPEGKRDLGFQGFETMQRKVAALLKEGLRRSDDMVARYDSQHFVVMMPGVGVDGSAQIGERLRGCVEEMRFFAAQKRYPVTVTVGTASIRAKRGTPREKLIEGAVQALEQARAAGSNVVCVEGRGCIPKMS